MIRRSMEYDYQKDRPTNWVQGTVTAGPIGSVASLGASELDAFLSMGGFVDQAEQDMAQSIVDTAVEMVYNYTGYEPTDRSIQVKWDVHPEQVRYFAGVSPVGGGSQPWIKIPRYPVQSVDSIDVGETTLTTDDYESDLASNPPRVALIGLGTGEIVMDLTVGPNGSLDPRFKQAVLCAAAYMYENRGCAFDSVLKKSGAMAIARALRVAVGGL